MKTICRIKRLLKISPSNSVDLELDLDHSTRSSFGTSIYKGLEILSRFYYFFCIIPYKVQMSNDWGSGIGIKFKTSRVRQVVSYLIHLFCSLYLLIYIYWTTLSEVTIQSDPQRLFRIASGGGYVVAVLAFTRICFKEKGGFKSLLHATYSFYSDRDHKSNMAYPTQNQIMATGLCCVCLTATLSQIIHDVVFEDGQFKTMSSNCIKSVNYFHMDILFNGQGLFDAQQLCSSGPWQIVIAFLYIFHSICLKIIGNSSDLFAGTTAFAFYILSKEFWRQIEASDFKTSGDFEQVYDIYRNMKSLTEEINNSTDIVVLMFTLAGIPYFATDLVLCFDTDDTAVRIQILLFICYFLFTLLFAAVAHQNIQCFPDYVFGNLKHYEGNNNAEKWHVFLTEISTTQIGLKGGGFFLISYSFLGNVVGLLLTYIIIILQLQRNKI